MSNIIKIKRGLETNISKSNLQQGELAITTDTNKLYVGTISTPVQLNKVPDVKTSETTSTSDVYSCSYLNNRLNKPKACASFYKTDSQSISDSTTTQIIFNCTDYVDDSTFALQNDGTIKVLKDITRVQVNYNIRIGGGYSYLYLYCLSTSDTGFYQGVRSSSSEGLTGSGILQVKKGDYIYLKVYVLSGSSFTIHGYNKGWCGINVAALESAPVYADGIVTNTKTSSDTSVYSCNYMNNRIDRTRTTVTLSVASDVTAQATPTATKDPLTGLVQLRGLLQKNIVSGWNKLCTIPSGYIPTTDFDYCNVSNATDFGGHIRIYTSGELYFYGTSDFVGATHTIYIDTIYMTDL